jgi:hypothetical protein
MSKVKLEFTFKGRKNTYFRRMDIFGKPLITTNVNSAKLIKEGDVLAILKKMIMEYGKESITDVKPIKEG